MQPDRPTATTRSIPMSPDELETGRFLDLARALDRLQVLATRTESLVVAIKLQLARVPWEVCEHRQREVVRLAVTVDMAEIAALESALAVEQLVREVVE